MNMEYVRGLRDYFAKLKPEQIDQRAGEFVPAWSNSDPCGCVGVHTAIFNDSSGYDESLGEVYFLAIQGKRDNDRNGLTVEILRKAYYNIGGNNDPFNPYGWTLWGVPVVDVLNEVLRMHSE